MFLVYLFLGLKDPRRKSLECKVRRTSADSGIQSSFEKPLDSAGLSYHHSVESGIANADDVDDRPGTPLYDENPENFVDPSPCSKSDITMIHKSDPISLPLPEFARRSKELTHPMSTNSLSPFKFAAGASEHVGSVGCGASNTLNSEIVSASSPTPMDVSISSASTTTTELTPAPGDSENHSLDESSSSGRNALSSKDKEDGDNELHTSGIASPTCNDLVSGEFSDSDDSSSPRTISEDPFLDQQILSFNEKYDRWHRDTVRPSTSFSSHSSTSGPEVNQAVGKKPTSLIESSAETSPRLTKPILNLDQLRKETSDIGKTFLTRKSVFDEDLKRLENFGEKYEGKAPTTPSSAGTPNSNWGLLTALNRSSSSSFASGSVPSSPSLTPTTPGAYRNLSVTTPTTPTHHRLHALGITPTTTPNAGLKSPVISSNNAVDKSKDLGSPTVKTAPATTTAIHSGTKNVAPSAQSSPYSRSTSVSLFPPTVSLKTCDFKKTHPSHLDRKMVDTVQSVSATSTIGCSSSSNSSETLPRCVERSQSLDSSKHASTTNNTSKTMSSPLAVSPGDIGRSNSTPIVSSSSSNRRASVDSQKLLPPTEAIKVEEPKVRTVEGSPVLNSTDSKVKLSHQSKSVDMKEEKCHDFLSTKSNSTSTVKEVCHSGRKKSDLTSVVKDEVQKINVETTAAIAFAAHTTGAVSKDEVVSSSSKKDKELKRRSSGSLFAPAPSSSVSTPNSNVPNDTSNQHPDVHSSSESNHSKSHNSKSSCSSSSGSSKKDKKEKREKDRESKSHVPSSSSEPKSTENVSESAPPQKPPPPPSTHVNESVSTVSTSKRKDKNGASKTSGETDHSMHTPKESASHNKRHKDSEKEKVKRRLSSHDNEQGKIN